MVWHVTHIDHHGQRHQAELECEGNRAAQVLAEAMFGPASYLAVVRLKAAP